MKTQLLMISLIFAPTFAMAATPDLNGSWVRNAASSDPTPNLMYWTTRTTGGGMGGVQRMPEVVLNIHQDGKTLHVAESNQVVRDYVFDSSPHTRPTDTLIQQASVTAHMQGDTFVIDTLQPYGGMPGNATLKTEQVWSVSPDGKTLTIITTRDIPARQQTYKEVYTRTQATPGAICSAGCVVPTK